MKIAITGDTHSNVQAMRKLVNLLPPVELLLHTGDHAEDANLLENMTGVKTVRVRGNCDLGPADVKLDEFLELEGYNIWLTHGHKYIQWNEKKDLDYWAHQLGQNIVIYGHTHIPVCEYVMDTLLINPGSPSRQRGGSNACFAVLTLAKGQVPEVEFITLK